MVNTKTKRAGDVTGRNADTLAQQAAAQKEEAASRMSMITATARKQDDEVVDLTDEGHNEPVVQPEIVEQADQDKVQAPEARPATTPGVVEEVDDEVVTQDVEVQEKIVEFRVNEDLENVTIGQGTNYNFFEGKKYRAPKHIYNHLEEKGYIWH